MDVFGRGAVRELKVVRVEVVLQVLAVNDGDQRGIQRAKRTASKTEPSGTPQGSFTGLDSMLLTGIVWNLSHRYRT